MDKIYVSPSGGSLYQGDYKDVKSLNGHPLKFDLVVLAAYEFQPPPIEVHATQILRAPYDDATGLTLDDVRAIKKIVDRAASVVAKALSNGKRVLVSCAGGYNRSGMISAIALVNLGASPDAAINLIQLRRPGSLCNPEFVQMVQNW